MTRLSRGFVLCLNLGLSGGALTGIHFEGGAALGQISRDDDESYAAARLELMVLRTSLAEAGDVEHDLVSVPPSAKPITVDQAAQALARIHKPVICTASPGTGGVLSVDCKPISTVEESGLHGSVIRGFDHQFQTDPAGPADDKRILLVYGSGERLKLSLAAFRRWYQEYLPPLSVAFGSDKPSSAEHVDDEAVEGVIRLLHVDPVDPEDPPPELRFLRP